MSLADCTVVVPTIGRPSLDVLLDALAAGTGPRPAAIVLVDDRRTGPDLAVGQREGLPPITVARSRGLGPAGARNVGWRLATTPWIAFLDDDVVPDADWFAALDQDLSDLTEDVAGSQGRLRVPLPDDRPATDWERVTAGLADGAWITADMAYRRDVLSAVGGFDERFPRAFREDADLALRVLARAGSGAPSRLVRGERWITHPVRPADRWVSVRVQRGNGDDVLMRRLHGPEWRQRAQAGPGRRPRHLAITAAGITALTGVLTRRRNLAAVGAVAWLAGTAEFAHARLRHGIADRRELTTMLATSAAIPPAATTHFLRGLVRHRAAAPWLGLPELVLFDRDGTLVVDVPYNGDPALVRPVPFARESLDRLRDRGIRVGVVTNQSGIARGLLTREQVDAVNARVEELLGPFDVWQVCPHSAQDGCACRKPAPGMIKEACHSLGVDPARSVVVGDIGADVNAARAAGARGILVPTPVTRTEEVAAAECVVSDVRAATDLLLGGTW